MKKSTYSPIGIDIENGAITAVQFRRTRSGLRVHATAKSVHMNGESPANLIEELQTVVRSGQFAGRDVVTAISNRETDIRPIHLPPEIDSESHPEFWEAVRMEASSCLLYTPDDAVLDYLPLDGYGQSQDNRLHLLLIAARKESVNRHLALLRAAKLHSVHLDVGSCAAARALGSGNRPLVIVDYGPDCTTLTMAEGRRVLFSRTMRTGHRKLAEAVEQGLGIPASEAIRMLRRIGLRAESRSVEWLQSVEQRGQMPRADLAAAMHETCFDVLESFSAEINRSLEYFSAQRPGFTPEKVLLAGPLLPLNIDHCLSSRLSMPIEVASSLSDFADPEADACDPAYVVAAGLAMRGVAA